MNKVSNHDLNQFIICAFRYACTRNSPSLSEMLYMIMPYWGHITPNFRHQIKYDIQDIVDRNGMELDEIARLKRILLEL